MTCAQLLPAWELKTAASHQNAFFIIVPCLPRGALVELVAHYASDGPHRSRTLRTARTATRLREIFSEIFEKFTNCIFQILVYSTEHLEVEIMEAYKRVATVSTVHTETILDRDGSEINFAAVIDIFEIEEE